jgi:hypothetical protein
MKRIFTLVIAAMLMVTIAQAQDNWVTQKVDARISIKFPGEPKQLSVGNFSFTDRDNVGYGISVVDFVVQLGVDSLRLAKDKTSPDFLNYMKETISESLHDGTIEDFKISTWKGFTSYSNIITGNIKKAKMYLFMVLIGNKMYSVTAIIPNSTSTKPRDDFFASLVLNN